MPSVDEFMSGKTLAEMQGMTAEVGGAIVQLAGEELRQGRLGTAREILEGVVVTNPRDPAAWAMLAQVLRRRGQRAGARFCAEAAVRLAPGEEQARLVRAEVLLGFPEEAAVAREELRNLARAAGQVGERARSLLAALGG